MTERNTRDADDAVIPDIHDGIKRSIRLRGLPSDTEDFQVNAILLPFGPVKRLRIIREPAPPNFTPSKPMPCVGEALAMFDDEEDAAYAKDNLEGAEFFGHVIQIDYVDNSVVFAKDVDLHKPVWEQLDVVLPDGQ